MSIKHEIQAILMQAAEIKQCREMLERELAEIERYHNAQCAKLNQDIAKIEIKIALEDISNDNP
jgi:hypothetical protein